MDSVRLVKLMCMILAMLLALLVAGFTTLLYLGYVGAAAHLTVLGGIGLITAAILVLFYAAYKEILDELF